MWDGYRDAGKRGRIRAVLRPPGLSAIHPPIHPILRSKLTRWELRLWVERKSVDWVGSSFAALLRDTAGKRLKPSSRSRHRRLCYWGVSSPSLAARTLKARDRKYQGGPVGHVTPQRGRHDTFRYFPPSPAGSRLFHFLSPVSRGEGSWDPGCLTLLD